VDLITLPLFPLGLIAFPGEQVNLHIFEPRYKQLVHDCRDQKLSFGIAPYKEGHPMVIGTEMKLLEISQVYDDGKMDVKTQAMGIIRIHEFYSKLSGKLYPGAEVERVQRLPSTGDPNLAKAVLLLVKELYESSTVSTEVSEWHEDFTIYELAHKIGLSFEQELQLLHMEDEDERLHMVERHLKAFIPQVKKMQEMKAKIQMNGHFKNVQPPELG